MLYGVEEREAHFHGVDQSSKFVYTDLSASLSSTKEPSSSPWHSTGMIRLSVLIAAPALLLAACAPLPSSGPVGPSSCDAEPLASEFVGQDASVIFATTFTAPIRVIRPGNAATEDFNPARINFVLDANERVARVYCG